MTDIPVHVVSMRVSRLFRKLIDLELAGKRDSDWERYSATLTSIALGLKREPREMEPLHLERGEGEAPRWVRRYPELAYLFDKAAAYPQYARFHHRKSA